MITAGRMDKVRRSVGCYLRQTYPNKELVILSQGTANNQLRKYLETLDVDVSFYTAPHTTSIGGMRNTVVELSHGSIICQWDDDDLYHPLRLMRQFNALSGDGIVASLYQQHLKWFEDKDEIYWIDWSQESIEDRRYLQGTAMFYKDTFCDSDNILYPDSGPNGKRGEDWSAVKQMLSLGGVAGIQNGEQYIYTYHGTNVYPRSHHELVLRKRVLTRDELIARRPLLERSLKECGVDRPVKICSAEGVAFEFTPEV